MTEATSSHLPDEDAIHDELVQWFSMLGTDELTRLRIELIGEESHLEASEEA